VSEFYIIKGGEEFSCRNARRGAGTCITIQRCITCSIPGLLLGFCRICLQKVEVDKIEMLLNGTYFLFHEVMVRTGDMLRIEEGEILALGVIRLKRWYTR